MALKTGSGALVPPFLVMDVIAAANALAATPAAADRRVIRMEVGQPGQGAPAGVRAAVAAAMQTTEPMGYTEALGRADLRARIAAHYADWYDLALPAGRIAVTSGASAGFPLAFLAAFEAGDRIALATPCYPPYLNIMTALGIQPVLLPATAETGFQPTVAMLAAMDPPPAGLLIASPANPTGSMLSPDDLASLARYCHANGIRLISDEIYHGLTYGKAAVTAASFSPSAIIINSFSKYFSMTGWRVGWMVVPDDLIRPVECLAQNFFICAPHISQTAAFAAFDCHAELQSRHTGYARSRALLLDALPRAGFDRLSPADGAFYLYADISGTLQDSTDFCRSLLHDQHIAATPGHDFDPARGGDFVRFSYCAAEADIVEAIHRLVDN
ncbi:MAG: 1-aminocyclopropane-1-carboxylate deaminase [Acidiphilium sp. 37-64-53]|uniref:pyridoxal phosphate-dependent aminotransferase n=1 Tax=Acidiphilium TaxID=522 RepID=UPI000BCD792D|nr:MULTISPECIES: aminotransferase class I/II-fold pyridoxal phosphate-dependent enzyme [Acidiphilium]OYW03761.1 MAG: 1-aminocyclopropane-1-carboxylate deaminase [Acidiphilium sp. 37-64-53]OZB30411.1 MAG: 1-aminocyclopropane-1-carboxylate deaminase [Acidiphilium sp. 34-64-41]HQT83563.1 aminotransferase class I/II-fold pyridoxal phosphate-dependent enzyme [Acidiphilium rubrum]